MTPLSEGARSFPTHWNSFQWELWLNDKDVNRLMAAQINIQRIPELLSCKPYPVIVIDKIFQAWAVPDLSDLDFEMRTVAEGLLGTGILRPMDWPVLHDVLASLSNTSSHDVKLRVLESLFIEERIHDIKATVRKRARSLKHVPDVRELEHVVMIRTVQVTPTRLLIGPPQQEASNTVTRRYNSNLDDIIRVQFVDEGDRLHVSSHEGHADHEDSWLRQACRRAHSTSWSDGSRPPCAQ